MSPRARSGDVGPITKDSGGALGRDGRLTPVSGDEGFLRYPVGTLLARLFHADRLAKPEAGQPSHARPMSSSGSSMNGPSSASAGTMASFEGRRYTEPFQPSRRFLAFRGGPVVPFPPTFRRRRAGFSPAPPSTGAAGAARRAPPPLPPPRAPPRA